MTTTRAWIYAAILGQALTLAPATAQTAVNRDRPRSSYDPGAADTARKQKPGGVETALGRLNPGNKDYGAAIDTLRLAAIEETVDNYLWWMSASLLFLFSLAAIYIYWLRNEREVRLDISADIVAQLWNAHCGSRRKAIESIDMYNTLMRRFNAQTVELREARGGGGGGGEGSEEEETGGGAGGQDQTRRRRPVSGEERATKVTPRRKRCRLHRHECGLHAIGASR